MQQPDNSKPFSMLQDAFSPEWSGREDDGLGPWDDEGTKEFVRAVGSLLPVLGFALTGASFT